MRNRLKSAIIAFLLIAGLAFYGTGASAHAQGRGYYGGTAPNSWSGIYLGVNAGAAWGDIGWDYGPPEPVSSRSIDGGIFGMHVGIQHQWNQFVLGLEASFSGSLGNDINGQGADFLDEAWSAAARLDSVFTIGPRIGWALTDKWLAYGTGGYASANLKTVLSDGMGTDFIDSSRHAGWFLGIGTEYALTTNWILGVEYLHLGLDDKLHSVGEGSGFERRVDGDVDIVRARLSFKFGRDGAFHQPLK